MAANSRVIMRAVAARPDRRPGKFEDEELEIMRMGNDGTPQEVVKYRTEQREYGAPFNYPNFHVELGRLARTKEGGAEYNMDGVEIDVPPWGAITFEEEEPIIGVAVIGSSCSPPGTILLHGEPIEWVYPRTGVKMKVQNLWGEHINGWPWREGLTDDWREAGLSSADFQIPECKKVTLMGWSQMEIGQNEVDYGLGHDGHYCFRTVRVTVKVPA